MRLFGTVLIAAVLLFVLYFHGLTAAGLLGPDEPRYASIGREMARSGDWVTPRLWGQPWFEKPALLYWLIGAGFRARLGEDLAPRIPVVLVSLAFLWFFYRIIKREFGEPSALASTLILASSAMWFGYSRVGVTDIPLSAAYAAAMLLLLGERPRWAWAAALLGVATLAKGLVPLVLAAPLAWFFRRQWREALSWRTILAFCAVAVPWYWLCYARNGFLFYQELFLKHQFGRFSSDALQHVQPWWFYLPVLLGALAPWTPLLLTLRRRHYADPRMRLLFGLAAFGFVFFSAALNKLPGYILPLLPLLAAQMGVALAATKRAAWYLAACALPLWVYGIIAAVLPQVLVSGLDGVTAGLTLPLFLAPVAVAVLVWLLEARGQRTAALGALALAVTAAVFYIEHRALGRVDQIASARVLWRDTAPHKEDACVEKLNRAMRYGLNYYSVTPLPDCADAEKSIHISGR